MIDRLLGFTLTGGAFVVVLGIIIFVHELGHFLVAKLFRMRVFIFSFGFGKRLFGFKRGDTDYRVSLVPLGGYVKLEGEADDYLSENTVHEGDGRDFLARPRWQRFLVYVAGPLMNVVLAVGVFTAFYLIGVYESSETQSRPIIGAVEAGMPAAQAGLLPGDEIVAIDSVAIARWEDLRYGVGLAGGRTLRLTVRRDGVLREMTVQPLAQGPDRTGVIGVGSVTYVLGLQPGFPAERAGLRVGDGLLSGNGKLVRELGELSAVVVGAGGQPVVLRVLRDGRVLDLTVAPEDQGAGPRIGVQKIGFQVVYVRLGPLPAIGAAVRQTGKLTMVVVDILGRLIKGQISFRTLGGPIRIAQESGQAARQGGDAYFGLIAFLSINVGILNLLPLVPLDGGHLLLLTVEGVMRRELNTSVKTWLMNAGAIAVFALIGFVILSDLSKMGLFGRFLR